MESDNSPERFADGDPRRIITVHFTEKEAIGFHLVYSIGASLLTGDVDEAYVIKRRTFEFLFCHMNAEEIRILKAKVTQLAASISPECLERHAIRLAMRSDPTNERTG